MHCNPSTYNSGIIPALVTMQVLKQQGRWPGAGGVYGGYPVSRVDARRRYESVRARHEDESYRRVGKGGAARMRRCATWRFSRASRLLFWVWGRSRCVRALAPRAYSPRPLVLCVVV